MSTMFTCIKNTRAFGKYSLDVATLQLVPINEVESYRRVNPLTEVIVITATFLRASKYIKINLMVTRRG